MYNEDGKIVSELTEEKTDEELAEALSGYQVKKFPWWRIGLSVLTVVAVVLMFMGFGGKDGNKTKALRLIIDPWSTTFEEDEFENIAEAKFKAEPTHKGYFMNYALGVWGDEGVDVEELLRMADEIDPENSLYHYIKAGTNYREVINRIKDDDSALSDSERFSRVTEYEVLDQETYDQALGHIVEAGKRRGIIDHFLEVRMRKLNDTRERVPQDFLGRMVTMIEAFSAEYYAIKLLDVSQLISAKFYELSIDGTEAEVIYWKKEYLKLLDSMLDKDVSLLDALVIKAVIQGVLPNMRAAAVHVGMDDEVKKITKLLDLLFLQKQERDKQHDLEYDEWVNERNYSKLAYFRDLSEGPIRGHLPANVVFDQDDDPTPGRLLDHAFIGRSMATISFLVIGAFCIGMWIFYWNKSKEMRLMSNQVLSSLNISDGIFIGACGVVLPIIGYVWINEKTSLGVREWSVSSANFLLIVLQFFGMLLTVLTLSSVLMRRALAKSLPEIVKPTCWYHWGLPVASFTAMLLVGLSDSKSEILPWAISFTILSIVALSWIGTSIAQCFLRAEKLVKVSMCRGLLSLYAVILIIMATLSSYYHSQEFEFVKQDESFAFKEEHLGLSLLEFRIAQELKKEALKNLELIR